MRPRRSDCTAAPARALTQINYRRRQLPGCERMTQYPPQAWPAREADTSVPESGVRMPLLEELASLGSFINAIAMVGSVIYLAIQVRQSNRLARLSALDALRDGTNHFREILLAGDNVELWLKGIQRNDQLTEIERYRWDELALYLWNSTQATYLRAVHLGERFAVDRVGYAVRFASRGPLFHRWWGERRERFHPDFVRFVDGHLVRPAPAQPPPGEI